MNTHLFRAEPLRVGRTLIAGVVACMVAVAGLQVTAPVAHADNDKIDLTVDVRETDASGGKKTTYWTGENVSAVVRFAASGTALSIPDATLTVCATALPYENMGEAPDDAPQLTPSTVAESSTRYVIYDGQRVDYVPGKKYGIDPKTWTYHPGDKWCIDYHYTEIKGGMLGGFPAPFTFRNGVTPDGTTRTIDAVLKESNGTVRIQDSLTLTARASSEFSSGMLFEGSAFDHILPDGTKIPNIVYDGIGEHQKTHTPHYLYSEQIRYATFADPVTANDAPAGAGAFDATRIRYVLKLPPGATLSARSDFKDWVIDSAAGTATWEGPVAGYNRGVVCREHRYCRPITLDLFDVPVYDDPVTQVKKVYEISSVVTMDPGLPSERVLPEHRAQFVFHPRISQDGRFSFGIDADGPRGAPNTITYSNGRYAQYGRSADPTNPDKDSLSWSAYLTNSNADMPPAGTTPAKGQGLYEEVTSVRIHSLDPRLYFNAFSVPRHAVQWKHNSRQNDSNQDFVDAFNAADASLYGITDDGTRELIQAHLTASTASNTYIPIRDEVRRYKELEVTFAQPFRVDNARTYFTVTTYLTEADRQKWDSGGYPADQLEKYTLDMGIHHRTNGSSDWTDSPTDPDKTYNHVNYGPALPRTEVRAGVGATETSAETYSTNLVYDDCVGVAELTPDNCKRVKTYYFASYPEGTWMGHERSWKNLKHVVLLPPGVKYLRTPRTVIFLEQPTPTPVEPTVVENFKGTGRTALVYSYGDVGKAIENRHATRGAIISYFDLDTTLQAEMSPAVNTVDYYVTWDDNDISKPQVPKGSNSSDVYTDALDLDGDGNTSEQFLHTSMRITLTPPAEVFARKNISLDGQQWLTQTPPQDLGGDLYYRYTIINNTDDPLPRLSILDVLPQEGDHDIVAQRDGTYKDREWNSTGATGTQLSGQHSAFRTPLTQGLDAVPANAQVQPELGASANDLFDYYYSLTPQGADLASVRDAQWLTSTEVAGRWDQVMNVKVMLKPGKTMPGNKTAHIVTRNTLPYNDSTKAVALNSRAVASLAYSTDLNSYVEASGRVESSNISYTLKGLAFNDTNKNGNFDTGEQPIVNRAFTVVDENGAAAHDPAGKALTGVTDAQGRYSLPIYTRGTYSVKFASSASEEISSLGNGGDEVANHATLLPPAGAGNGLYAQTSSVTLNPENLSGTRNIGLYTLTRDVPIRKVDDAGGNMQGVGFTLTWVGPLAGDTAPATTPAPATVTTDANGRATFGNVLHGRYTLSETTVPTGYTQASDITLDISGNELRNVTDGSAFSELTITNTQIKGTVTVTKVDEETRATLAGATFELYRKGADGNVPAGSAPSYTLPVTGADGVTSVSNVLYGDYELREKTAPTGYLLSTARPAVSVTQHGQTVSVGEFGDRQIRGTVQVKKLGELADPNAEKLPQAGVEFGLYDVAADGTVATTTTRTALTDANGIATFTNVPFGTYRVKEKTPLASHRPSAETEGRPVVIDAAHVNTPVDYTADPFVNFMKRGAVTVAKVDRDQQTIKLPGVSFGLFRKTAVGVETQPVATEQTDANGIATFMNVAYGDYVVKETATIEGYVLDSSDARDVQIRDHGQLVDFSGSPVTNQKILGSVRLVKKDAETRQPLAGAEFALTQLDGTPVSTARSAADGTVLFERVPYGLYEVKETAAPEGYVLEGYTAGVNIATHEEVIDLGDVFNARVRGEIIVRKIDAETQAPIEGVSFGLFPVPTVATPSPSAPVPAATPAASAQPAGASGTEQPGNAQEGSASEEPLATALTDAEGIARFPGTLYGRYVVREVTPAPGYRGDTPRVELAAEIADAGDIVEAGIVENQLIRADVHLTKVDGNNQPLAGAVFELRGGTRDEVLRATSGADGSVLFPNVAYGHWSLTEVYAPAGYVLSREVRELDVTEQGTTVELGSVVNRKNPKMAVTGADTMSLLVVALLAALAGGAAVRTGRRRI